MKYISPIISDARNKLGGSVWARNRSGTYVRSHVAPTQPRTASQQNNRALFGAASQGWKGLTPAQRLGWNALASSSSWTDTLGKTYTPSGFQLYVSNNRNLQSALLPPIENAPGAKPDFPVLEIAQVGAYVGTGAASALLVDLANNVFWGDHSFVAQFTQPMVPSITFIPPFAYRNVNPEAAYSGTVNNFVDAYNARLAPPVVGQQIGCKVYFVDPATGYASTPAKFAALWQ